MSFGVTDDEWDIWMEQNRNRLTAVLKFPIKSMLLKCKESGLLEDAPDLEMILI
jgi:hypothetical protein